MKRKIIFVMVLFTFISYAQEKNTIAIIGTFHFHLVKPQFGIDYNIMDDEKQAELNGIAQQIALYKPTKIFVEWDHDRQEELDQLYELYQKDRTYRLIKEKFGENENMYFESEVQQLGFRIADKHGHKKLYAFNYNIPEPNDTIMNSIHRNNQTDLMTEIQKEFGEYSQYIISKFQKTSSIKEMLLFFSSKDMAETLNSGYISLFNKVGSISDHSGAYFVSERYKRNLYMYSLIQKQIESNNERILVIVGAQHAAAFFEFAASDSNLEIIELTKVFNKQ